MIYESHPNGVAPEGNLYFANELSIRQSSLGTYFNRLSDETIQDILSYCSGQDLSNVVIVSKILYCYASFSDLWRDITLREFNGKDIKYRYTWKDTYYYHIMLSKNKNADTFKYQHPLKIKGVYSNYLHQSWLCHTFDFETTCPGFLDNEQYKSNNDNEINVVSRNELTINEFISKYEIPNIPVVIKDVCECCNFIKNSNNNHSTNNPNPNTSNHSTTNSTHNQHHTSDGCLTVKWTNEYLSKQLTSDVKLRATSATAPLPAYFTIEEYFQYAKQAKEEAPLYLFERNFTVLAPTLLSDYQIPPYFNYESIHNTSTKQSSHKSNQTSSSSSDFYDTDLFRLLGENERPDYRWLIAGPARSGSIFHIDPNQTNAWNLCIRGRKKWIFYPPDVTPPGIKCSPDGAEVAIPISIGEWLLTFWKYHLEARQDKDPKKRPLEIILYPGQVIFVPHGWWHMVINLEESIALTHNYVSTSNLSDVLNFLREKQDQISGLRDRSEVGAIHIQDIYDTFILKLKDLFPIEVIEKFIKDSQVNSLPKPMNHLSSQQICAIIAKRYKYNMLNNTNKRKKRKKLQTNKNSIIEETPEIINNLEQQSFTFGFIINSN